MSDLMELLEEPVILFAQLQASMQQSKGLSLAKARFAALENAVKGQETISAQEWRKVFQGWSARAHSVNEIIVKNVEAFAMPTLEGMTVGYHLRPTEDDENTSVWLRMIFYKITDALWAWKYWVEGENDKTFREKAARAIWAISDEGKSLLKGRDIESVEVQKELKVQLRKGLRLQQAEIAAKTRILQAYARFGPIVVLDAHWQHRSFKDHNLGPTCQQSAVKVFQIFLDKLTYEERTNRQYAGEWSLVHLVDAFTEGDYDSVQWIKDTLFRLRASSLLYSGSV
ncbi:hypothetical protein EV361DRAFT_379479 [Lentinula raphanica]|nr:hypothetical protein EV361DRAFT_379479 [Lentinula raphanica]